MFAGCILPVFFFPHIILSYLRLVGRVMSGPAFTPFADHLGEKDIHFREV